MEAVLDVYKESFDPTHPLICMDESSRQVLSDVTDPLPMQPGRPKRIDDKYERHGVRALLMFYNPVDVVKVVLALTGPKRFGVCSMRIIPMPKL